MPPLDKIAHFLAGSTIAAALLPFGVIISLFAVIVAAAGKELWDMRGHGTPDSKDAIATIIGGALMAGWLTYAQLICQSL